MNGLNTRSPIRGFQKFVQKPILRPINGRNSHPSERTNDSSNGPTMNPTASTPENATYERADKAATAKVAGNKRDHEDSKEGEDPTQVSPEQQQRPAKDKDASMDTEPTSESSPAPGGGSGSGGQAGGAAATPISRRGGGRNAFQVMKKAQAASAKAAKKSAPTAGEDPNNEGDEDVDMAEDAESYTKVAARKYPAVEMFLFVNKVLLFITFKVFKSTKMSTGDNIRNRSAQVLDLIIESFTACIEEKGAIIFLPLKSMDHSQVLQRGSQLPKKYSGIRKFLSYLNQQDDFTKTIGGEYGRQFRMVARVATKKPFAEVMGDLLLDLAIEGVEIEVKQLQVVHSKADMILLHVPRDLELDYVREEFPRCLEEAKREYYNDTSLNLSVMQRNVGIAQPPFKINIEWNFAPNSYDNSRRKGGGRSKTPPENKKVFNVEYNTTQKD